MRLRRPALLASLALLLSVSSNALALDKVFKYNGSGPIKVVGKSTLVVSLIAVSDGKRIELFVPNKDPNKMELDPVSPLGEAAKSFKPGDWVTAEADATNKNQLKKIEAYTPKPHELTPTGYTMGTVFKTQTGRAVQLTKLGESLDAAIAASDPQMDKVIETLNAGDAVDVELTGAAKKTIVSIARYAEPVTATFESATEVDLDGQKVPAVELMIAGKKVTAIIAGKTGKKWTPDKTVAAFVKGLKEGNEILVTTSEIEGKAYLRRVARPKKAAAAPKEKEATKEKPEKKAKEPEPKK